MFGRSAAQDAPRRRRRRSCRACRSLGAGWREAGRRRLDAVAARPGPMHGASYRRRAAATSRSLLRATLGWRSCAARWAFTPRAAQRRSWRDQRRQWSWTSPSKSVDESCHSHRDAFLPFAALPGSHSGRGSPSLVRRQLVVRLIRVHSARRLLTYPTAWPRWSPGHSLRSCPSTLGFSVGPAESWGWASPSVLRVGRRTWCEAVIYGLARGLQVSASKLRRHHFPVPPRSIPYTGWRAFPALRAHPFSVFAAMNPRRRLPGPDISTGSTSRCSKRVSRRHTVHFPPEA